MPVEEDRLVRLKFWKFRKRSSWTSCLMPTKMFQKSKKVFVLTKSREIFHNFVVSTRFNQDLDLLLEQ